MAMTANVPAPNRPSVSHRRPNLSEIMELQRTPTSWQTPRIIVTVKGCALPASWTALLSAL